MIEQHRIDAIKRNISIVELIRSKGTVLKKNGQGYCGLCPFHNDKETASLSVTPSKDLFQCFGCGKAGDVIKFVQLKDQVDFKTAVVTLEEQMPAISQSQPEPSPKQPPHVPEETVCQLLERAMAVYLQAGSEEKPLDYLRKRGITDIGFLDRFQIGFCANILSTILPREGKSKRDLISIGIMNDKDQERFHNCMVFPVFDVDGNITTLYGRSIKDGDKRHCFLPNRANGLWNSPVIKIYCEIILVEGVIDGLSVDMAGLSNVVACHGVNGLSDNDLRLLKEHGVSKITALFDNDEAGRKAGERLKKKINQSIALQIKILPDGHDPNSYLVEYGPEKLAEFIRADPLEAPYVIPAPVDHHSDSFFVAFGMRRYEIIGLDKGRRKLRAAIRLEYCGKSSSDTIDFYSARARKAMTQEFCRVFNETPETIESDITKLMLACEQAAAAGKQQEKPKPEAFEMSAKEKAEAIAFGKSPDLIARIVDDFEICGLIGEESNKLLGYLVMTSRKLKKPLSVLILSSSGAGKTALQDMVTGYCPPEDLVKLTVVSDKALFYKEQDSLKNKVLALEEGEGVKNAAYAIRSLISNGVLICESTIKDLGTGRLTTMENRVEGPTSVFFTTTNPDTDPETLSRFFVTGIDESPEQTRKILAFQRTQHMKDNDSNNLTADAVFKLHHNFQRLLKPSNFKFDI